MAAGGPVAAGVYRDAGDPPDARKPGLSGDQRGPRLSDRQMDQLRKQMETLAAQAKQLQRRKEISESIYQATLNFRPVVGHIYHLYRKQDSTNTLSLIAPDEWGRNKPYTFLATCQLLYDHTWEVLAEAPEETFIMVNDL